MSDPTGFHVRHDLQPELTYELLLLLRNFPSGKTQAEIQTEARIRGYKLSDRKDYGKLLRSLSELGLLVAPYYSLELSSVGQVVATMIVYYPYLLPDFIHFLYYTAWEINPSQRFSWSYKTVCEQLWKTSPSVIDRAYLVSYVIHEAEQGFNLKGISFSSSSIAGILNWLGALQPACITTEGRQQIFNQRSYCSVELFALALSHVYKFNENGNSFVPLTPTLRQVICCLCLITPEAFNEMLDQTENHFTGLQIRRERGERYSMSHFSWADIVDLELPL